MKYSAEDIPAENVEYLCEYSQKLLEQERIELEDYAALAYLKYRIYGFEKKIKVNNVVMDEAQDYSMFQFYILKEILDTDMFTILGDIAQGIHAYRGISDWNRVMEDVFEEESSYKTLVQSYRTTIVMELANEIIKNIDNADLPLAKPVIRHGEKPEVRNYEQERELDLKLLYVAMTRPLHRLYVYQQNDSISVLNKIDDSFYECIE
ncbi:UvrD-helicase domain-containing protein [Acetohalobium arabaticum]|uniref:UvrD-helicase domain-containing protein n=1 Tax=Acetohalobium arabaticum TaxID=28187 RepID=UPI000315B3D3|nr:UvrD-helicase domain-containing protein [Acetohalobium arabaticum]